MEFIYGKHSVLEALEQRPDCVARVYADSKHTDTLARFSSIHTQPISTAILKEIPRDAVHQGIIAQFNTKKLVTPFRQWMQSFTPERASSVVILGELTDPQNVGAIIRSAVAFGVSAILIPEHRSVGITGTVIKVSVGTIFNIPIVEIPNTNTAIRDLKETGFWIYGLDMEGDVSLPDETFDKPSAIIVGNEAKGIRQKTREHCDIVLSIPMHGKAESLNAATATAVTLYAWSVRAYG